MPGVDTVVDPAMTVTLPAAVTYVDPVPGGATRPLAAAVQREHVLAKLNGAGASVEYVPGFFDAGRAAELMETLLASVTFDNPEQSRVFMHGRWHRIPRQQTAYGDPGTHYRFSGCVVQSRPWVDPLARLRRELLVRSGIESNFVLVNLYRDGRDSVGWHADDERDLGHAPTIASLSLGAERRFQFRAKPKRGAAKGSALTLILQPGSLLLMRHPTNRHFQHQLPKCGGSRPEAIGPRLNLTWRYLVTS